MRSLWSRAGLPSNTSGVLKGAEKGHRHAHRERTPCDDRDRDGSGLSRLRATSGCWQRQKRGQRHGVGLPPGSTALLTPCFQSFSLQNCVRTNFCHFTLPSLWLFDTADPRSEYTTHHPENPLRRPPWSCPPKLIAHRPLLCSPRSSHTGLLLTPDFSPLLFPLPRVPFLQNELASFSCSSPHWNIPSQRGRYETPSAPFSPEVLGISCEAPWWFPSWHFPPLVVISFLYVCVVGLFHMNVSSLAKWKTHFKVAFVSPIF